MRRLDTTLIAAALMLSATACQTNEDRSFAVQNDTDTTLNIFYLANTGNETSGTVPAGDVIDVDLTPLNGDCTTAPLVARTPDGVDVATRPPGFCAADVWVIEEGAAPAPS
jgi:hypothetical protein